MKSHFETEVQGNSEMAYLFSVVVGISFWPSVSWVASFRCSVSWAVVQKMMSKKKEGEGGCKELSDATFLTNFLS